MVEEQDVCESQRIAPQTTDSLQRGKVPAQWWGAGAGPVVMSLTKGLNLAMPSRAALCDAVGKTQQHLGMGINLAKNV